MMSDFMLRVSACGLDTVQINTSEPSFERRQFFFNTVLKNLKQAKLSWLFEVVVCEYSMTIQYDCAQVRYQEVKAYLKKVVSTEEDGHCVSNIDEIMELPADYSLSAGGDLEELSFWCNLSIPEIIKLHSNQIYQVTTIGFAPGFAYMKGLDKRLEVMRKNIPTTEVPAGAIAIANQYTAVYPQSSPGGWWLIGHCPINLFDPTKSPPSPLKVGQKVRFVPCDKNIERSGGDNGR